MMALGVVHELVSAVGSIGNPAPTAPPGVGAQADKIIGYVKWGVLLCIVAAGFIGAGAVAAGHFLSHHRSSQVGVRILISTVAAAVIYAGVYAFVTGITG